MTFVSCLQFACRVRTVEDKHITTNILNIQNVDKTSPKKTKKEERTLALLDDGLDVADAVTGLGVDGHGAGKGLHKELHGCVWWNFSK